MSTANNLQSPAFPPEWNAAVQHSRVLNVGYVSEAARTLRTLPSEHQDLVHRNIVQLAAFPATAKGVEQALKALGKQAESFPEQAFASEVSGTPPGRAAMTNAGMCLIHGLVAQAAASSSDKDAAVLVKAIKKSKTGQAGDRDLLLREILLAVGREKYIQALEAAGSKPRKG